jgi:hypothetical protein
MNRSGEPSGELGAEDTPFVSWAVAATRISKDAETGAASALFIIEDIELPKELFDRAKKNFVTSNKPFEFAFVVDWRWPIEIENRDDVQFNLIWTTPSGKRFGGVGSVSEIPRPKVQNRAKIHVKLDGVPVREEGIYFFEVVLNKKIRFRYPIRLRCATPLKAPSVPKKASKKPASRKKPTTPRAPKAL